MSTPVSSYALIAGCVAALAVGQVLFKICSSRIGDLFDLVRDPWTLAIFLVAISIYAGSTLAWVLALRMISLNQAYVFMSASFVIVPILSYGVLGERISSQTLIGSVVICAGVIISSVRW
jgi:drug/metabolite transporter (DMT)-like permease